MKSVLLLLSGFLACAIVSVVLFAGLDLTASAQRNVRGAGWEYASVTGAYLPYTAENPNAVVVAAANICVMNAQGCTNEEVRVELSYGKFLQDMKLENTQAARENAQGRAMDSALAKAFAKLGAEGWEMVSSPELQFDNYVLNSPSTYAVQQGNRERKADVYFKRAKQQ